MEKDIGYSDFLIICKKKISENWDNQDFTLEGLEVKHEGVWVTAPSPDDWTLSTEEKAILSEHPKKDLGKPALPFPCSLKELEAFFKYYGAREQVKLNPKQILIAECRKTAAGIWEHDKTITISAMYRRDEIKRVCGDNLPSLKTFRERWMKGLCPNRSPGRRKGT